MTEAERLAQIIDLLDRIEAGKWTLMRDSKGAFIEALGEMGEILTIARFALEATDDEIAFIRDAAANLRFATDLVQRAIRAIRPPAEKPRVEPALLKNYAAEAAMKCHEPAFKKWLEERHGLERPLTDERVAQRLRSVLGIRSRRELNDNVEAAARWKKLRGDYDAWRRAG